MNIKYTIEVEDEDTGEVLFKTHYFSLESLEEEFYKIERVLDRYKEENEDRDNN